MTMIPTPSEIHYFLEVGNTLNISRAAVRLGISQPTLSLSINKLEHAMGASLLIRSKNGVTLTRAGKKILSNSRSLLDNWDKLKAEISDDEFIVTGQYIIGCHPSVALYSLPSLLPGLLQENPKLEFKLIHDLSRKITEEIISFHIDFGIVVNPWNHPDLVIKILSKDEVTFWVSEKHHPLQDPRSGFATIICDTNLVQTQYLLKQMKKIGISYERLINSSNLEVITSLVAAGAGIGIIPGRVARRIQSFKLRVLDKSYPVFNDKICLVYRADAQKSKSSKKIIKWIESHFNPDMGW